MGWKGTAKRVILIFILVLLFLGIQYGSENPYFSWYFDSLYRIESARIEALLTETGEMHVHETISYRMRKPFRGVFREIIPARYDVMEGVTLWTEGIETQDVEYVSFPQGGFSARVWLVPRGSTVRLDPREHPRVTLHVEYRVRRVVENGQEIAQIFRQLWGEWDAPVGLLEGIFDFPQGVQIQNVYTHPRMFWQKRGNRYLFRIFRLPPKSIAEVRFLFPPLPDMPHAVANPVLSREEVEKEERTYHDNVRQTTLFWTAVAGIFMVLFLGIYLRWGRETPVDYERFYEQELPYQDPPDLVNAVVRHFASRVGEEGVAAVFLDLYHRGIITFEEEGKRRYIRLNAEIVPSDLPSSERKLLELLQKFAIEDRFSFEILREKFEQSVSEARAFNALFAAYENEVKHELRRRRYLENTGNILAKTLGVVAMFVSLVVVPTALRPETAHLLFLWTTLAGSFFFGGGAILLARKDAFGRWSQEGRLYVLRWQSFARFLIDYSLLSEHPPHSVLLWEKYLIYATALGIAREVIRHMEKLVPREVFERESSHPYFYHPGMYLFGNEFYRLRLTATSTIAQSQARSHSGGGFGGGFSGGTGGFGRGSGGGRGGAF